MPSKWVDRQIDEVLLTTALSAGSLYARRRARRVLPKVLVGAAVVTTVGAAAAATGIGVLAIAWYRHRRTAAAQSAGQYPIGGGGAAGATFGSGSGESPLKTEAFAKT